MFRVSLENLSLPGSHGTVIAVARIPVIGDMLYAEDRVYTVKLVMLAVDPKRNEPVAIVRVTT